MNTFDLTPAQVRDLMYRTTDPLILRSLVKLEAAIAEGDDMLRIEAEDELEGVDLAGMQ